jgi:Short C-terminal domain
VSVVAVPPHAGDDRAEALARLDRLREDGALSEGEFEAAKRRLGAR